MPSAGQGRSGVCIFQMWACASTMMRRAGCAAAGCGACAAIASPAPAPSVLLRTSRRDNMCGPPFVVLDARLPGIAVIVACPRQPVRPSTIVVDGVQVLCLRVDREHLDHEIVPDHAIAERLL